MPSLFTDTPSSLFTTRPSGRQQWEAAIDEQRQRDLTKPSMPEQILGIAGNTAQILGAPIINSARRMQQSYEGGIDASMGGGQLLDLMALAGGGAGAAERGTVGAFGGKPSSGWFGEFLNKGASGNEKISAAAVRMKDGRVLTGPSHIEIVDSPHINLDDLDGSEDGFVTSTGRFVDRKEAARIAGHTGPMRFESSNMKPSEDQ